MSRPHDIPEDALEDLRGRLEGLFQRSLVSHSKNNKKQKSRVRLDDSIVECFSSLSPKCRDEELEDFLYFILDLYQFHGVSVAIAEVDVDHVVVDLRTLLEEHTSRTRGRIVPQEDSHLFLVLDKNVLGLPWESLPILRGQSVSRIPSIDFLIDRLDFEEWRRKEASSVTGDPAVDRAKINPRSTYYVLNPSGDLGATQGRFSGWLKEMHSVGWQGVVGKAPSEQQVLNAMSQHDLFMCVSCLYLLDQIYPANISLSVVTSATVVANNMYALKRFVISLDVPRPCSGAVPLGTSRNWASLTARGHPIIISWLAGKSLLSPT